jgi:hypothetical protein
MLIDYRGSKWMLGGYRGRKRMDRRNRGRQKMVGGSKAARMVGGYRG